MNLKSIQYPNINKKFVSHGFQENKRLDDRNRNQFRDIRIGFGRDFGLCVISLGHTKVMGSVSCEISEPKATKSSEGLLNINVDLSPMANPQFEGRLSTKCVEITRMIEKSIRDSKCVDLESLCLIKNEKVWALRVDIITLNDDGNLIECCSVAALAALAHFKRPDVTVSGDKVIVHNFDEKHPIPLTILHYPFCTSFVFCENCYHHVVDPTAVEEQICDGYLVIGANSYREITALHISGQSRIPKEKVMLCCTLAIERVKYLTRELKSALLDDKNVRASGNKILTEFSRLLDTPNSILSKFKIERSIMEVDEEVDDIHFDVDYRTKIYRFVNAQDENFVIGEGGTSAYDFGDLDVNCQNESSEINEESDNIEESEKKDDKMSSDSEEEVIYLKPSEFTY